MKYNKLYIYHLGILEMTSQIDKINEFIELIKKIREKGELYEEERSNVSGRVKGFLRAIFGEQREAEYLIEINRGKTKYITDTAFFCTKCKLMLEFFTTLKEEIEARQAFQSVEEPSFSKLEKNIEKNKTESERRKNVAEFKYWGFAIELIDTVRQELKKFRQTQEELLESINKLRKELKESKEKF